MCPMPEKEPGVRLYLNNSIGDRTTQTPDVCDESAGTALFPATKKGNYLSMYLWAEGRSPLKL